MALPLLSLHALKISSHALRNQHFEQEILEKNVQPPLSIEALRTLTPGLPRGSIVEITGPSSSGRTALVHSILAAATGQLEICAMVDCASAFDPASAVLAGTNFERLLWVQAGGRLEKAIKAADLILHGGGFGVVVLDLCGITPHRLLQIPLSYWYRFRRAVEKTPTTFVVASAMPVAKSCAAMQLEIKRKKSLWQGQAPFRLLTGAELEAASRKPCVQESKLLRAAV